MPYKDKEKYRQYLIDWRKRNKDYHKNYRKTHPDKEAEQREKHLHKVKARSTLNNAVAIGHIERKPCGVCGDVSVEAHHHDYNKPLDVTWLCRAHHEEMHHPHIHITSSQVLAPGR
jgi:hypothetical protein